MRTVTEETSRGVVPCGRAGGGEQASLWHGAAWLMQRPEVQAPSRLKLAEGCRGSSARLTSVQNTVPMKRYMQRRPGSRGLVESGSAPLASRGRCPAEAVRVHTCIGGRRLHCAPSCRRSALAPAAVNITPTQSEVDLAALENRDHLVRKQHTLRAVCTRPWQAGRRRQASCRAAAHAERWEGGHPRRAPAARGAQRRRAGSSSRQRGSLTALAVERLARHHGLHANVESNVHGRSHLEEGCMGAAAVCVVSGMARARLGWRSQSMHLLCPAAPPSCSPADSRLTVCPKQSKLSRQAPKGTDTRTSGGAQESPGPAPWGERGAREGRQAGQQ